MADDQSQRPYRASEPPVRGPAKAPVSDPLAELARLIGQTDPFGEFGRESARRAPAPQPEEHSDWNRQPAGTAYSGQTGADMRSPAATQRPGGNGYYAARSTPDEEPAAATQGYGRQPYSSAPTETFDDLYQAEQEARAYPPNQAGYEQDVYAHDTLQQTEDEYYDDVPPSRRRLAVMAIAGVFALAVIGTAGAFGYRALFGSASSNQPPPVIKADTGPSKIVPAAAGKDAQFNKLITDRVNERGQGEKLVSREEQPVDKATTGSADAQPPSAPPLALPPPPRTTQAQPVQPPPPTQPAKSAPAPARAAVADTTTADAEADAPPPPVRSASPSRQAPASSNAPLSLNPDAAPSRAPARAAPTPTPTPTRTASVTPPAQAAPAPASTGGAGSFVQISSQRSEADAQAAFRGLQAKFPTQLGGRQASVHKVDLGAKGTYYRAMVGPFANANEAAELCSSLKAAGGQCLIQRN